MAFGGGNYLRFNKIIPGVYTNTITVGLPVQRQTRGIVAGGFVMDWGPDGEIFEITKEDFQDNAVERTGHAKDAPENILFREAFQHATRLVGYKLNSKGSEKAENTNVGEAKYSGEAGNNITVTCYRNINEEDRLDVSTYFNGVLKEVQTVPEGNEATIIVNAGEETKGSSLADDLQNVKVDWSLEGNSITATFTDLPEGYTPKTQLKLGSAIAALMPGRIDLTETDNTQTITFSPEASTKADYTFVACVQKNDDKSYSTLSSYKFNLTLDEESITGADVTKLDNNDYVTFKSTGVIPENSGYVFEGGVSAPIVTTEGHTDFLAALENRTFNTVFCDVSDETIKETYLAFNKRMREERGVYFQVVFHDFVKADYEGAISVNNIVLTKEAPEVVNRSSLVVWVAGYSSAVELKEELTNKPYDGELDIDVSKPDIQNENLIKKGHFLFHRVSLDEIYTLIDINSFVSFTDDKNHEMQNNKVVRTVDYIHNEMAYELNRNDIGRTANNKKGRDLIWAKFVEKLQALNDQEIIQNFKKEDVEVRAIEGNKWAVEVIQRIMVTGTIRYIYVRTYVHEVLEGDE